MQLVIWSAAAALLAPPAGAQPETPPQPDAAKKPAAKKAAPKAPPLVYPTIPPAVQFRPGATQASLHEGFPSHQRWLLPDEKLATPTLAWNAQEWFLPRLPRRYDDWGIRDSWKGPVLLRLAAEIELPAGRPRFLLRARGLALLWIDGELVAKTKPQSGSTDGHEPVAPLPDPPVPGARIVGYGEQETFGEKQHPGGKAKAILEVVVGGPKYRAETGELLVAVLSKDSGRYELLQPAGAGPMTPVTDAALEPLAARAEAALTALDDRHRRAAAKSQDAYWERRHEHARQWLAKHPTPPVPPTPAGTHPVDAFLADHMGKALAAAQASAGPEAEHVHGKVLPILRQHCFRCHGDREKSGLRLDTRAAALAAGDSGEPAFVPGHPANSHALQRLRSADPAQRMPPSGAGVPEAQIQLLEEWTKAGMPWPAPPVSAAEVAVAPLVDDAAFLRRAWLDALGLPPPESDLLAFLHDPSPDKRPRIIDRLLDDERWADHWVPYWQDVLAENPNTLKPSLNNTGPFRWFLLEALRDRRPADRWATELAMLRGSEREGGSAGFGMAADNDAPLAARGQALATAFLGIDLQCARCHDAPFHSWKQADAFALAAMLGRKPAAVPKTSTVAPGFFENQPRGALIKATLKPNAVVAPQWPFAEALGAPDAAALAKLLRAPADTRERLAAHLTAPENQRFAPALANRAWRRLLGAGFVEPPHDWEGKATSHPQLLEWLAKDFVAAGYDFRHLLRRIMTSAAYQRVATGSNRAAPPHRRFFAAPDRRRLSAEQVVDSLAAAAGQRLRTEELTFDPEGRRDANTMISLGRPARAWQFATLSNERDRPSLALPRAQAVVDVLEAFGWTASRQSPVHDREAAAHALQPGVLANGVFAGWMTRAADGSELAELAVRAESPGALAETLFRRFLGRTPNSAERAPLEAALAAGFAGRIVPLPERQPVQHPAPLPRLSWSNHLAGEANVLKVEMERQARAGDPPDPRLRPEWRAAFEDVAWTLVNAPEFVWTP